jgi:hypothetical protein
MLSSTGLAISVARRLGSSIRAEQRIGLVESLAREIGPGDERLEEVRASSVIAKCGAWSWLLPPNTGPGFHGDVSPKNILVGPQGPVFTDAECAWFGVRSCLLPQSPVAQMPVSALGSGSALGGLSKPDRDLP